MCLKFLVPLIQIKQKHWANAGAMQAYVLAAIRQRSYFDKNKRGNPSSHQWALQYISVHVTRKPNAAVDSYDSNSNTILNYFICSFKASLNFPELYIIGGMNFRVCFCPFKFMSIALFWSQIIPAASCVENCVYYSAFHLTWIWKTHIFHITVL